MVQSSARVSTDNASRYLQQLCKHWGHRFAVQFDPQSGTVQFPDALCRFEAESGVLVMTLETADGAALPRLQEVVTRHLQRFAFREDLAPVWTDASS